MELKKSYKGFIIWMIVFMLVSVGAALLPIDSAALLVRIINNICGVSIALLAYIIYQTEFVYWYNSTSYEQAVNAGSERRKIFAWKHFKRFGLFALIFLFFSVIAQLAGLNFWIDFTILCVGFIAVAVSTIWIKL